MKRIENDLHQSVSSVGDGAGPFAGKAGSYRYGADREKGSTQSSVKLPVL